MTDLFSGLPEPQPTVGLTEGACLLPGRADLLAPALINAINALTTQAPLRRMTVPGGRVMSVAMSNCGTLGWVSDRRGYRYSPIDPDSGRPWPPLPAVFLQLAIKAAVWAGFPGFHPDSCLINDYVPGARMGLHQDHDERDLTAPIVSVSLGLPAIFLWGGRHRRDPCQRIELRHGDIVVWGGSSRLNYHGITPLKPGAHPLTGAHRFNLTFRRGG